eukprot:jgi/Chrzof1/12825/Cz07g08250.t1
MTSQRLVVVLIVLGVAFALRGSDAVWNMPQLCDFINKLVHSIGINDQPAAKTVADLAAHAPSNITILTNALNRAGLQTVIGNPDWKATIFAPTNQAFEAALVKMKLTVAQLYADKAALVNILSYHVINEQALTLGDLKDNQKYKTVQQSEVTIHVGKATGTTIQGASDTAKIIAWDLKAGQAVVHVVDTVLIPPPPPSRK